MLNLFLEHVHKMNVGFHLNHIQVDLKISRGVAPQKRYHVLDGLWAPRSTSICLLKLADWHGRLTFALVGGLFWPRKLVFRK